MSSARSGARSESGSGTDQLEPRRRFVRAGDLSPAAAVAAVRSATPALHGRGLLDTAGALHRATVGAGPLAGLLADPDVTDVCINGPGAIWVDRGQGMVSSGEHVNDDDELRVLAARLIAAGGRRLDEAEPFADARLSDGTRVHAVLPPISPDGVHLSLRVPPRSRFDCAELVRRGSIPAEAVPLLAGLVQSGMSFLVTGGTGTGKTTVLGCLLGLVPAGERVVIVEDSAELRPDHPHVVRLEARRPNAEGRGGVGLDDLVRQALRMRPDRLVVGEARGGEIGELLMALNTGHTGGCGTLHVDSPQQVPARVEALASLRDWSRATAMTQLGAAVEAVVHLIRAPDGRRVVDRLAMLVASADGVRVEDAWRLRADGVVAGPAAATWQSRCT